MKEGSSRQCILLPGTPRAPIDLLVSPPADMSLLASVKGTSGFVGDGVPELFPFMPLSEPKNDIVIGSGAPGAKAGGEAGFSLEASFEESRV